MKELIDKARVDLQKIMEDYLKYPARLELGTVSEIAKRSLYLQGLLRYEASAHSQTYPRDQK